MKVVIVQRRLTHYRVPLFEKLRKTLASRKIDLELLIGEGTPDEQKKRDSGEISWAIRVPTHYFVGGRLNWQPIHRYIGNANLIIVTQENSQIFNHFLILMPRKFKLAFWGHGANLQSRYPNGISERYKRWTTKKVDWWFCYTQQSATIVESTGFPTNQITVLNNTVDTVATRSILKSIIPDEKRKLRHSLELSEGPIGIYIGSLYKNKRLEFLFSAAEAIRKKVPNFQLLIIGDGPERSTVHTWCSLQPWGHWVGVKLGREKVKHLSLAKIMLNPGLVGLGILDAFACQLPIVTTDCGIHSPEIAYLENGKNGVMTQNDLESYVDACVRLLHNPDELNNLRAGCVKSATEYTIENMVHRFANGIVSALS